MLAVAVVGVFLACVAGCGGSGVVVAWVGGSPISAGLLGHWESIDREVAGGASGGRAGSLGRVLGFLIFSRWLVGEARARHVVVSDGQAKGQLEVLDFDLRERMAYEALPLDPQLRGYLVGSWVGASDRLWLMKLAILAVRLEERRVARALGEITEGEIVGFYERNQRRFWEPERRDLEVIGNQSLDVVRKAKREIREGKDFLSIARRVSTDQEAPGGLEHPLARGEEEKPYDRVVFSAKPHTLVGPVEQTFYYIFEVIGVTPAHEQPLAQAEPAIKQRLAQQRASTRLTAEFQAAWAAKTICRTGYRLPLCGQ
jgi:hypothetical protein